METIIFAIFIIMIMQMLQLIKSGSEIKKRKKTIYEEPAIQSKYIKKVPPQRSIVSKTSVSESKVNIYSPEKKIGKETFPPVKEKEIKRMEKDEVSFSYPYSGIKLTRDYKLDPYEIHSIRARRRLLRMIRNKQTLRTAVVLKEVIGPPVSMRVSNDYW